MGANRQNYAIVFADVSGSSRLYKETGNAAAKLTIDEILERIRNIVSDNDGKVIKTIGDEVMASFEDCNKAAAAAQSIQRTTVDNTTSNPLQLRIGMDFGDVLEEHDDLFGDVVNDAAFVSRIARGGQIIMTANVLSNLKGNMRDKCREFDRITLKGGNEKISVYLLSWEGNPQQDSDDMTVITGIEDITGYLGTGILALHYQQLQIELNAFDTPFTLGRSIERVSLHIDTSFASREHCQIIHRRGKFVLCDNSTNGTYISQSGRPEIYLRREELPLSGAGVIAIGQSVNSEQVHLIKYLVVNPSAQQTQTGVLPK